MRAFFIIFLVVATLLISSNAATVNPQASHHLTQSTDADNVKLRSGRLLRIEARNNQATDTIDEERAVIPEGLKKLRTSTSKWFSDKTLATKLHFHAMKMNLDDVVEKLEAKGVDPNRVYEVLKLNKKSNQKNRGFYTGEYNLWQDLAGAYQIKNPKWKNNYA
ncbi:hypothetical protein F441_04401 [Phytophthora nicotianae CJ01A1]|uniref:RxLR effector protein n=3 Tax=Phytophthora nicotianae TaxID=4792 RepID=W2JH33_PHYNI|nr:hypothetical protein L916_04271 [Phytophthora nicotianae]ETL98854.1 hypothetical protein L917_04150 [Phytophthora nicotianae]ETO81183.1 hypothetical protein F444_04450 [Phytophthora nicotianae P1976]ETP22234.1 hypothetical protein F441_04401 [Phytophthora nicotianae CJ01A1]